MCVCMCVSEGKGEERVKKKTPVISSWVTKKNGSNININ